MPFRNSPSAVARASMTSAQPTCWSGWSISICETLLFLETLNLTEGFALSLARYLFSAVRSAAVTSLTAFSLLCCFVCRVVICASPSDLASQYVLGPTSEGAPLKMGLKPHRIQVRRVDYRC